MKIVLSVQSKGQNAKVYAWADKKESLAPGEHRCVRIWHTPNTASLVPISSETIFRYESDPFVVFTSSISFGEFCRRFSESEYNRPELYKLLSHNCVIAARFALSLADINLPLPRLPFHRPLDFLPVPVPLLTPLGLLQIAKDFQCSQLAGIGIPRLLEEEKERLLGALAQETPGSIRRQTTTIATEIMRRYKKRPHHAHCYQKLLKRTSSLLSDKAPETRVVDYSDYKSFSTFFCRAPKSPSRKVLQDYGHILLSIQALWLLSRFLGPIPDSIPSLPEIDFIMMTFNLLALMLIAHALGGKGNRTVSDTPLSLAMTNLVAELNQRDCANSVTHHVP